MKAKTEAKQSVDKQVGKTTGVVMMIILSLLLGIVVGLVINLLDWHMNGYPAVIEKLNNRYHMQVSQLNVRSETIAAYYLAISGLVISHTGSLFKDVSHEVNKVATKSDLLPTNVSERKLSKQIATFTSQFWSITWRTVRNMVTKLFSVFAAFWFFVFAALLGAIDGLVKRYVRTSEGGRESTFIFHKVTGTIMKLPLFILIAYLTVPMFFNPEIAVISIGAIFFSFFFIATSQLKKYL